jgi:hypothetical protein
MAAPRWRSVCSSQNDAAMSRLGPGPRCRTPSANLALDSEGSETAAKRRNKRGVFAAP